MVGSTRRHQGIGTLAAGESNVSPLDGTVALLYELGINIVASSKYILSLLNDQYPVLKIEHTGCIFISRPTVRGSMSQLH